MSTSYKMLSNIFLSRLISYADEITGVTNVDLDVSGQRLIRFSISVRFRKKGGSIIAQYISYL
jgi:hypothetical protein